MSIVGQDVARGAPSTAEEIERFAKPQIDATLPRVLRGVLALQRRTYQRDEVLAGRESGDRVQVRGLTQVLQPLRFGIQHVPHPFAQDIQRAGDHTELAGPRFVPASVDRQRFGGA